MTSTTWPKAVARSLADQVVEPLLMRIAAGHLAPGVSLPAQRDLAKELGVGLPVLREAMPRLQSPRVRQACHGQGTVVQGLGRNQLLFEPSLSQLALEARILSQLWRRATQSRRGRSGWPPCARPKTTS